MKLRKRAAASALALAVLAPLTPCARAASAQVSNESVSFDGAPSPISAYNIGGSNYFMLRDLAALLSGSKVQFSVETDVAARTIRLTTGQAYTRQGDELSGLAGGTGGAANAVPSQWALTVNGSTAAVDAYAINGYNFYKLRDLGDAIGFAVSYNASEHRIDITSEAPAFQAEVPASAAVDPSWFSDAAFVGDSVSGWLSFYAGDKGLGSATFLTATSLGIENALKEVSGSSVHPSYRGTKMKVEDAIAQCGAKKVYIMLGMNDITYGVERVTNDYIKLLNNIRSKSPNVQIYVQSVIPMISTSSRADSKLNNANINAFNETMKAACQQNHWYYLDVASVYRDEYGALRPDACADPNGMGLHVTAAATSSWVDYLRTHVPSV